MVKLKRTTTEDMGITSIPASAFPQNAVMYYGMKRMKEANLKEYQFFFTVYDKKRDREDVLNKDINPDYVFKSTSQHSLESDIQNSGFLTDKDFGVINKLRDKDTRLKIGFILEPTYSASKDKWDFADVYMDVNNNIILDWRH